MYIYMYIYIYIHICIYMYHLVPAITDFVLDGSWECCNHDLE